MTATQLTIETLAESEAELLDRNEYLEATVRDLSSILADLAFDRCLFETLARGWLVELSQVRKSNEALRDEIRRFTSAQCAL
jgi:hypothetical protein